VRQGSLLKLCICSTPRVASGRYQTLVRLGRVQICTASVMAERLCNERSPRKYERFRLRIETVPKAPGDRIAAPE